MSADGTPNERFHLPEPLAALRPPAGGLTPAAAEPYFAPERWGAGTGRGPANDGDPVEQDRGRAESSSAAALTSSGLFPRKRGCSHLKRHSAARFWSFTA